MKLTQHIFFTGFMGSGKSTHGKKLAHELKIEFIDLDHYIQKKVNKTIQEIFVEYGESFFRTQEKMGINEILAANKEPRVIALGGGAICFHDMITLVKENGLLIYLETNENVLFQRLLNSKKERPLLKGMTQDDIVKFIRTKLKEREIYYKQAHLKVNALNLTTAILVSAIEEFYKK